VAHIRSTPGFELVAPPSFALTLFRVVPLPDGAPLEEKDINALNRAFFDALLERRELLLTQTELGGTFCIRFAVGAARTNAKDVEKAWGIIHEVAEGARARSATAA
jgi:aromatic-L-amino-acid decarboxylase